MFNFNKNFVIIRTILCSTVHNLMEAITTALFIIPLFIPFAQAITITKQLFDRSL